MSTSEPVVKLYDPQNSQRYWDISPIITSVNIAYGRNQPFAMAEVVVKKAYFTSIDNYWGQVPDVPKDGNNNPELPTTYLVDGLSPIHIEAYGDAYDMCVERHESEQNSDYLTLLCYNKAYKLKSATTLNSLCKITLYTDRKLYFAYDTQHSNPLTSALTAQTVYNNPNVTATCKLNGNDANSTVSFSVKVSATKSGSSYSFNYGLQSVEYIQGTGTNLFKFIAMYGAGYTFAQCICDNGYTYNYGGTISNTYTSQQIKIIKSSQVIEGDDSEIIKLRVNNDSNFCWETLKSLGALSNRWPFFYDYAYFVDYNTQSVTSQSHMQRLAYMKLDYGLDINGYSTTYTQAEAGGEKSYMDLYEIVANADQGSTYVQTSQKVFGENYSAKVYLSDIADNHAGYELYFPYPEADPTEVSTIDNTTRNLLTKKIAFNRVVANYKPSDAVQFNISEITSQTEQYNVGDRIYNDVSQLPQSASINSYALVINGGVIYSYYKYTAGGWVLDESAMQMNDRIAKFSPYTTIDEIKDVQNGLTMINAPLAYTMLMWPSCLTQLTFGNPEFMDAQQQWSALTLEAQVSTEQGTEDSLISDRYASKLVIGNQTMSDLADNRAGFTGLIMEKNWDNDLYRLAGYNNGVLQAYFNSQGEIMSGDGQVIINSSGISIGEGSQQNNSVISIASWDANKEYKQGTIIIYNSKTYVATTNNSGVQPDQNPNYWQQLTYEETNTDVPVWDASMKPCSQGQMVRYRTNSSQPWITYISLVDNNNDTPSSSSANWQQLTFEEISTEIPVWVSGTSYAKGQTVIYQPSSGGQYTYVSLVDANTATPGTDTTKWQLLTYDLTAVSVWSPTKAYVQYDVVTWDGKIYEATSASNNTNKMPGTSGGQSYWSSIGCTNMWSQFETYKYGDTVLHNSYIYVAKDISGNYNREPGAPGGAQYWELSSTNTSSLVGTIIAQNNNIRATQSGGNTIIDSNGLSTYNSNGQKVCYVGTNGNIQGITISASQISAGSVTSGILTIGTGGVGEITPQANITVGGATNATNATSATYATSQGSATNATNATNATYATSQGSATNATYATSQGSAPVQKWSSTKTYTIGDTVQYDGRIYVAIDYSTNLNKNPEDYLDDYWQCDQQYAVDSKNTKTIGKISNGYVVIDSSGLKTYSEYSTSNHTDTYLECSVGIDGQITAGRGQVKLGKDGLKTYNVSNGEVQCSVGSNGRIQAGNGTVFLDKKGILIEDVSQAVNQSLMFHDSWSTSEGWVVYSDGSSFYIGELDTSQFLTLSPAYGVLTGMGGFSGVCGHKTSTTVSQGNIVGQVIGFQPVPTQSSFKIMVGFNSDTSATTTNVSFIDTFGNYPFNTKVIYAACTTIRSSSSSNGNDYVSSVTTNGMVCKHDSGDGFYWIAIGY